MIDILFTFDFSIAEQINLILLIFITVLEFIALWLVNFSDEKIRKERDKL